MNWNFYFSGILYAKIREETEALTARILDIETGNLGEERPFGEKENVFLQKLCSRSIAGFFEKKAAYEEKIAQEPEVFTNSVPRNRTPKHCLSGYTSSQIFRTVFSSIPSFTRMPV